MWIRRWQNLSAPQRVAAAATAAAVAVWTAVLVVPDAPEPEPEPEAVAAPESPSAAAQQPQSNAAGQPNAQPKSERRSSAPQQPTAAEQPQPPTTPSEKPAEPGDSLQELRSALASDNAGTRIGALRKLTEEDADQALPELIGLDVGRDPELAPTLIKVTAQLAQHAQAPQRMAAVTQLSSWLRSESARPSSDARGNVSVLVETLAGLNSPEAERALIEVLQSDQQPLHVRTLAVEGLARLASPAAHSALEQFRAQLAQQQAQGFELELKREAELATDKALARLSR